MTNFGVKGVEDGEEPISQCGYDLPGASMIISVGNTVSSRQEGSHKIFWSIHLYLRFASSIKGSLHWAKWER